MSTSPRKQSAPLSIRLSGDERRQLERLAGNQPLSAYARSVLLEGKAVRGDGGRSQAEHMMLARLVAALGKSQIGPSLETMARAAANGSLHIDEAMAQRLRDAFNDIAAMHYCLLWALGKRPARQLVRTAVRKSTTAAAG